MAAALPFSAIEAKFFSRQQDDPRDLKPLIETAGASPKSKEILEVAGVFRGRELTRKERRLTCGITPIDNLIGGGIVRGRISEITGNASAGKTSLAAAFAATLTRRGEVVAWIDAASGFDPASTAAAGVDLARMLWVAMPAKSNQPSYRAMDEFERDRYGRSKLAGEFDRDRPKRSRMASEIEHDEQGLSRSEYRSNDLVDDPISYSAGYSTSGRHVKRSAGAIVLKVAEWILMAGGFGLVVIDCGGVPDFDGRFSAFTQSTALRLARGAERSGAAVLIIAPHRMCGTFAALSLMLSRNRACFSRASSGSPVLFDGLTVEARVTRNQLGGAGGVAKWRALAEPSCTSIAAMPAFMHESATPAQSANSPYLPNLLETQAAGRRAGVR
jgi:recombination protein RecA